jgi:hypothetical protein
LFGCVSNAAGNRRSVSVDDVKGAAADTAAAGLVHGIVTASSHDGEAEHRDGDEAGDNGGREGGVKKGKGSGRRREGERREREGGRWCMH